MVQKKITIEAPTVQEAIDLGLSEIGLKQEQTYIEIIQEDSLGFFNKKEAIISIVFDEKDALDAIEDECREVLKRSTQIIYEEDSALAKFDQEFLESTLFSVEKKIELISLTLSEKGITDVDNSFLKELLNDTGSYQYFHRIKEFETSKLNEEHASIILTPSKDMMTCSAILFYPKEAKEEVLFEKIIETLKEKGIVKGIYKKSIDQAIALKKTSEFEIARGKKASGDSVSKLELFFQENERKAFQEMMEYLRIDTRDVKDLNVCERNQLLARVQLGEVSAAGFKINGEVLMGDGESSTEINLGNNVYWSEDKSEVFSNEAGHIKWDTKTRTLDVEPVYVVEGNIDFSEGNLEGFSGKVIIKGDVMPKFKVSVEGDIEIHGTVEDAIVESTRGSISILGSVIHHNEGYIFAKKDIHVTIAQNASIQARNIYIQKEAMNCKLKATQSIYVEGNPGVIVGGVAQADHLIKANVIGSANWVKTKIHAGDIREDQKKLKRLKREIRQSKSEIENHNAAIEILEGIKKNKSLSDDQEEELLKLNEIIRELEEANLVYTNDIDLLNHRIDNLKNARVEVKDRIFPQVDLSIYNGYFVPSEEEVFTAFICKDGRIDKRPI